MRRRADGQAARAAAIPQTAAKGGRALGVTTVRLLLFECLGRPAEQRDDDGRAGERDDDRRAGERPDRKPDGAQSHRHSHGQRPLPSVAVRSSGRFITSGALGRCWDRL